ncbi:MAG TPA: hypothetical protein VG795_16725 [Acidimicrobiia bacterium]|nr:hypothetical protein [Acidimicrobiia bacterium]
MRAVGVAIIAVVQVALAVPAVAEDIRFVALDPLEKTFALERRGCGDPAKAEPSCSSLATALGRRPGIDVRGFDEVTATLPSTLRSDCDVKEEDIGWPAIGIRCFDEADTEQRNWLTQGLAGTDEWRTEETPGGDSHYLVATWCWRGSEGFPGTDFCDPDERIKRTRISLISVERNAYRNVELVEPYLTPKQGGGTTVAARPLLLHAGGAAIAGRWLYVANTDWLYVFNLAHFIQVDEGAYQLPVWDRYVTANEEDRDKHNAFSSISIDGSSGVPRLVAAEYRLNPWSDAIVTVWPVQKDGRLPPAEPHIESLRAYTIDGQSVIDHVQGVASAGDFFVFSESSNRIERSPAGVPRKSDDKCIRWGDGTGEDLYASPSRNLLAGINESSPRTGSAFWAVSYRQAFRLEAPPRGYPRRTC